MQKTILYQGKKLCYRIYGTGETVLLIHGFGEDSTVWRDQLPALVNYKLIVPDLPGSGDSEMIGDMSMEGLAEIIKAILDTEKSRPGKNERAVIIGHSMGGYILLAFLEKFLEYVRGIGLFHSSAFSDSHEKKATRRKGIDFIREHGAFEFLKTATANLFSPISKDEHAELIDQQVAGGHNFSADALVSYYEAMINRPDRTKLLEDTSLPVLFIMGKYDNAVPMEDGLKQCHLPGKSYIHVFQESGHMGMLEEPGKTNRVLQEFLQETSIESAILR